MLYLYQNEIHLIVSNNKKRIQLKYLLKKSNYLTWSSLPSSEDAFVLSRRADLGINKLNGIDSRLSSPSVSSVKFEPNGFINCCDGLIFVAVPIGGKSVSRPVDPVFNHFHLLDFGGRCNGGLWLTDVIWDICDSCVSIRSEIVSSLSRFLTFDVEGNCKCWGSNGAVFVVGEDSFNSILGGGCTVVCIVDGGLTDGVGGVCAFGLFCAAARLSWDILRNFDINFRTGWSELIWSNPSFFLVSANSRSRLTSAILRKTI